jgi:hypothetical protein
MSEPAYDTKLCRAMNDRLRRKLLSWAHLGSFDGVLKRDRVMFTQGVEDLLPLPGDVNALLAELRAYDRFDENDDPYQEHDFGAFDFKGNRIFWKIDYYDERLEYGVEDPTAPSTRRVLTVMLAEEY